jgi:Ca-activated chloride channel family protein
MRLSIKSVYIILFFAVMAAGILGLVYAQDDGESPAPDRSNKSKPVLGSKTPSSPRTPQRKSSTFGVDVDLVVNYTSVFDKAGHFISGLKQNNFKVFEDGIEQQISFFAQEDIPVSMGFLLDLSGSMRGERKSEQSKKAAEAFLQASNPQDEMFMIGFNDEVELLQDYTSDVDEIKDALDNTSIMGSTALYDAIYLGVDKAHDGRRQKKAVVLITDGEDRASYYTENQLLSKAQESDVQIFCVGILDAPVKEKGLFGRTSKSPSEKAKDFLLKVSEETGGKAFFPAKADEIPGIVTEIANDIRRQYSIGYASTNNAHDGAWRKIKIEVKADNVSNDRVRYRRGYYAPKSQNP